MYRFESCVEALPPDQAAPLWRVSIADTRVSGRVRTDGLRKIGCSVGASYRSLRPYSRATHVASSRFPSARSRTRLRGKITTGTTVPTTPTIGYDNPSDYLGDAVLPAHQNFARLPRRANAMEFAVAAWHLEERLWHHLGKPDRDKFRANLLSACPELGLIRDLRRGQASRTGSRVRYLGWLRRVRRWRHHRKLWPLRDDIIAVSRIADARRSKRVTDMTSIRCFAASSSFGNPRRDNHWP